ncbi:hypothetical protein BC936DRAFT_143243 [Jimgerdemannia flammicorona]|uniref:Zn(2)-C6 fungal-type domain-containing protein n=1 Tax=Jimgerdemannia flammicorona TaxID=994334 RepID=A0A433DE83_9FUNG|nr:hypothetical protein BC936DRAFT_143243 [Jimgerdemannia flammicorona]
MNGQHHIDTTIDPKTSSLPGNPESPTDPANPKRKRLTQACDICRKKKIKCDGGKPSCANCVRHHLVCTYLPSNKKRGPRQGYIEMLEKRLDKMERMLQRSQGLSLDDDDDDQDDDDSDTPDSSPRSHRSSNNTSSNTSVKRPARALDDNDDDEEHDDQRPSPSSSRSTASRLLSAQPHYPRPSDFLGMDLDDRPPPSNDTSDPFSYFGPSSSIINLGQSGLRPNTIHDNVVVPVVSPTVATISSPALSSSSRSSNASEYNVTSSAVVMGKPLMLHGPMVPLTPVDDELPPREIIDHLVDTYFDFLFNQFPIIHQATFREKVRAGKVSKVLLLSVMAVAARFSDHPAVIENPPWAAGEKYATKARVLINRIFDIPILASVQAMILLSMHEYGCARGPRAWMYSGMAVRMAQELGLNKEDAMYRDGTDSFSRMDCIEQETRRRVFWCTFMIDKFSSSSTGRPQALDERDCDVLLPSDDTDWQLDHSVLTEMLNGTPPPTTDPSSPQAVSLRPTIGVYAYLLRMVAILGQVTHYVNRAKPKSAPPPSHPNSEFALLDQALLGWAASLPPSLSYTRENGERMIPIPAGGTFFLMHILHNTVAVLLHRPNLAIRHSEPDHAMPWFKQYLDQSVEKCLKAADAVTEILERLVGTRLVTTAPFIAYATYTVATVHVGNAFSSDQELAKKAKIKLGTHHRVLQVWHPVSLMVVAFLPAFFYFYFYFYFYFFFELCRVFIH